MISTLHRMGLRSGMMYTAGLASIGLAAASWFVSRNYEPAGQERADHWGLFLGEWAPAFFGMGIALRIEEMRETRQQEMSEWQEAQQQAMRTPTRAGV
ncbi:hypothetical protein [Microtetraspora sp. NBRC 16547]|uniref:hypothetical protein n=1 Tax=Microtetraspora sp. NBRC 16547 TaxID=3030993 RepID=UPI0024A604E2|nr:hypothetical protein [Microtetraspora sp. NBRC 16547]GLW96494.1 hypothetical protein Misp02_05810 [Microtetraspora sp. NBRC 16547]